MKKQTVCAVLLIFLFSLFLLTAGLYITERGLQDVSGRQAAPEALRLAREDNEGWFLVFAGQAWRLPDWPW